MPLDYIFLNGNYYTIRIIMLENKETVVISTIELNDALFDNNGQYISDYARYVDELIFFFVNKDELELPENVLSKIVYQDVLA